MQLNQNGKISRKDNQQAKRLNQNFILITQTLKVNLNDKFPKDTDRSTNRSFRPISHQRERRQGQRLRNSLLALEVILLEQISDTIPVNKLFFFDSYTHKKNYANTCNNVVKGRTNIGTLKTYNNKVSFAQLINFFSGFLLSSKTTIYQIGNFVLHLAVVITLNHYTEDDTVTCTLKQVLCFVWKRCKHFQAQVLTPCLKEPFLKFAVRFF